MNNQDRINKFAQSIHLSMFGRYIDDIEEEEGQRKVAQTLDWTNQFIDELEQEADWNYVRRNQAQLGTISSLSQTFSLSDEIRKLVADENRPLVITQDGTPVSEWLVVNPNQITEPSLNPITNRVTTVNRSLIFSRQLKETEIGGGIFADVVDFIPRLSIDDVDVLDLVKPQLLLILGVAKNATLPDIVQGGLSPSFAQKYNEILEQAKAENRLSSVSNTVVRDNYTYIGGIY